MRICVYSGSNFGRHPAYQQAAARLGQTLAEAGATLVYGGTTSGLMGILADAVKKHGGRAIGVIPHFLHEKGIAHQNLDQLEVVEGMHARKATMESLSDAFIALPGGIGTLEELFEVWTWAQLGFHEKPCAFYNVRGFYDHLLSFLDNMVAEAFMKSAHRDMLIVSDDPHAILEAMRNYQAPHVSKWIT